MKNFWSKKPLITKKAVLLHPQKKDDSVAQQVEHNTFNVGVLGSSPSRVTEKSRNLSCDFFLLHMLLFLVESPL